MSRREGTPRGARRRFLTLALLIGLIVAGSGSSHGHAQEEGFDPGAFGVGTELVIEGLSQPVQYIDANDGTGRSFVVQKDGFVFMVQDGALVETPFLDISGQISTGSEQGLLSIALHPDFAENGTFFIDYTDVDGHTRVERWRVSDDPDVADPASAELILFQEQPYPNHNGGLLLFGPDGYLYIGLGDGGSGGDPENNAQDTSTLLGSILRIDVDTTEGELPYAIPDDNPFVGDDSARPETWVYGLRNPWRFSFDRETGDLLIGDVGQGEYEEASIAPAGEGGLNFGWDLMEGPACYEVDPCQDDSLVMPIFSYPTREGGCAITGGYVYRGDAIPALRGVYLAADYCSGLLWGVGQDANGEWGASAPIETGSSISSFAEDAAGELYLVDYSGSIYRITAAE